MHELAGKVAIVTGASSGIGYATAKLFARHGAMIVAAARRKIELEALVAEIEAAGGRAIALPGNVTDEGYARTLVEIAVREFGGLDIAFNNAGAIGTLGPVEEMPASNWAEVLDANLTSAFLGAKYQIPAMLARGGGSLIFTSSFVGHTAGFPGMAAYAAGKSGLVGFTQVLATEYGPRGIRVNAILPGATDTPMSRSMIDTPEKRAFVASLYALKRFASPDEVARSVLYLASDAASFTTGIALLVDGGVSINIG